MKKEEKKIFWGFLPFDYRVSEALFSRMSEKGWMVKSVSPYIAVFEQDEPKKRTFAACVYGGQEIGEKGRTKYIEQGKKLGWKHACDYDRYFWFWTPGETALSEKPVSDETRLFGSAVWRKELYALILIVLAVGFGAVKLYNLSYTSFVTFSEFARLSLAYIFAPLLLLCGGSILIWALVRRAKLKNGTPLPVPDERNARLRRALIFGPVFLFFGLLVLAVILDACTGYAKTILLISPIAVVACVALIIRALKKRGRAAIIGRLVIVIAIVVCIAVYAIGNFKTFSSSLPEGADVATLSELDGEHALKRASYVHTASPAVELHFIYKEIAEDGASANTEYFRCRNAFFADQIEACIRKALEKVETPYTLTRDSNTIVYKELKAE